MGYRLVLEMVDLPATFDDTGGNINIKITINGPLNSDFTHIVGDFMDLTTVYPHDYQCQSMEYCMEDITKFHIVRCSIS